MPMIGGRLVGRCPSCGVGQGHMGLCPRCAQETQAPREFGSSCSCNIYIDGRLIHDLGCHNAENMEEVMAWLKSRSKK